MCLFLVRRGDNTVWSGLEDALLEGLYAQLRAEGIDEAAEGAEKKKKR